MKFREITFWFALMLANFAAGLVMTGICAHLVWYLLSFGWDLV
jgi:hypothetical protein